MILILIDALECSPSRAFIRINCLLERPEIRRSLKTHASTCRNLLKAQDRQPEPNTGDHGRNDR